MLGCLAENKKSEENLFLFNVVLECSTSLGVKNISCHAHKDLSTTRSSVFFSFQNFRRAPLSSLCDSPLGMPARFRGSLIKASEIPALTWSRHCIIAKIFIKKVRVEVKTSVSGKVVDIYLTASRLGYIHHYSPPLRWIIVNYRFADQFSPIRIGLNWSRDATVYVRGVTISPI